MGYFIQSLCVLIIPIDKCPGPKSVQSLRASHSYGEGEINQQDKEGYDHLNDGILLPAGKILAESFDWR